MVGAGVFLSAGFMAQDLGPGAILAAWVIGALIALAGVRAYSQVARWVPRSGGEYRYLSELAHPALGYLAGWGSLLVGFSAPVAINALAAGTFATIVFPGLDPRTLGVFWIVAFGPDRCAIRGLDVFIRPPVPFVIRSLYREFPNSTFLDLLPVAFTV